ncbi:hypothetical protein ACFFF7_15705 [Novosphingobium aquiterrae]|uniref:Uncharacterized protein n=1 Tax=Novosphingobium aquiterrae TaxID=624388 RepID=A0ABV6PLZ7_9SPHN
MILPPPLRETLVRVAVAMAPAAGPWWIISSAAVALHGADPGPVGDVDVLIDLRDAEHVLTALHLPVRSGTGNGLFRSAVFANWHGPPLPVEIFAGFQLCEGGAWHDIVPASREQVAVDEHTLWIPSRAELQAMLLRFGREKDRARAAVLSPSDPSPSRSGNA